MKERWIHLSALVAIASGLSFQKSIPQDDMKSLHKANGQASHQVMSRYYEDLGVSSTILAKLDPFKSGNEKLWLVSVETRGGRSPGNFEKNMQNGYENVFEEVLENDPNATVPSFPLKAKARIMKEWAAVHAEQHADELVLFLDHDTSYVGCSEEQFLSDVHEILAHSGADLIAGAELHCAPRTAWKNGQYHCAMVPGSEHKNRFLLTFERVLRKLDKRGRDKEFMQRTVYPEVPEWAKSLYNLNELSWANHSTFYDRNQSGRAETEMRFLNSGLVVGKAKYFAKMFKWLSDEEKGYQSPNGGNWWNDQHGFNMAYYDTIEGNTDETTCDGCSGVKVSLDYGTRLMFNLFGISEGNPPYEKLADGTYKNKLSGKQACFVHGNGHGKSKEIWGRIADGIEKERPDLLLEIFGGKHN